MAKTTIEDLLRSALEDPLFAKAYYSRRARIRRAIGETLIGLRERTDEQLALSEPAGWHRDYVANIERGEGEIASALARLEGIANAVDASVVVSFVDRKNGQVLAQLSAAEGMAEEEVGQTKPRRRAKK